MVDRVAGPAQRPALRGRAEECALVDGLLADLRDGQSRSLVLRGEAGIGKTALLEYLVDSASDLTVARAVGVESEMELAYASLHQLCVPMADRLGRLPAPQREALDVVFGLRAGPAPDRFLVGLATLTLLSEVAEERPLVCVVDDAQWLDKASALTLAFAARRLFAERVGMVFAAREPDDELRHVSELELRGLRNGDARSLLGSAVQFKLDDQVRDRIVAETGGNPLALLELPRGLTATQLAGGFGLEAREVSGRIEENFVRQLAPLPDDTRLLLLVAAAEPVGDPLLVWDAAARLGIAPTALEAAGVDALLVIGDRVTFRHPLVRSAVYSSAPAGDREAVHLALAQATDRRTDPDRRAWHLAAATTGPDERVAVELERSAGRAQARGGVAAAAAFLKRAAAFTRDPPRRASRALAAAQAHLQAGEFDEARRLLATAEAGALDQLGRARAGLVRGQIAFASSFGGEAVALLLNAARELESLDPQLARETYLDAWGAAMLAGRASPGALGEVARAALAAPRATSDSRPSDLLLDGLSLLVSEGSEAATPTLSRAVSVFADGEVAATEALRWGWLASTAAGMLWDLRNWDVINERLLQISRETGMLVQLPLYLTGVGIPAILRGDLATAARLSAEIDAIAEATGAHLARYVAVLLAGFRGREAEASGVIEFEARNALAVGQGFGMTWCQWASAVLYNGLGRYDEAHHASEEAPDLPISVWALAELIEAATRTATTWPAAEALERLTQPASASGTDWALGILARSRALLADGEAADGWYREAIERLSRTRLRPELARAHLVYGEWLRRENRRVDARAQLRTAHELFVEIGMDAFADRARKELHATGEHVRAHAPEARDDLTAQERQIAVLARDGLTNPEIGARLFLSPRTVEWHLRHVFMKLGIRSRRELVKALPADTESAIAPA
jgi:DNA-binding CsgD family transcriptional regulator